MPCLGETLDEIDLTQPERITTSGLVLDLGRFIDSNEPEARAIMQFANEIKALRSEPTYSVLVISRSDELPLAALIGCKPSQLNEYLVAASHSWEPEVTALSGSRSH